MRSHDDIDLSKLTFNAIDVETANSDPSSICQIGIVRVKDGEIQEVIERLINPEMEFNPRNISLHGIDDETVKDSPTLPSIESEIRHLLEGTVLVSHSSFDKKAVNKAMDRYGLNVICATWMDSSRCARWAWPSTFKERWSLDYVASALDIEFKHHKADEDARVVAEIVLKASRIKGLEDIEGWLNSLDPPRTPSHSYTLPRSQTIGVPPRDVDTCPECGKWKQQRYPLCYECVSRQGHLDECPKCGRKKQIKYQVCYACSRATGI